MDHNLTQGSSQVTNTDLIDPKFSINSDKAVLNSKINTLKMGCNRRWKELVKLNEHIQTYLKVPFNKESSDLSLDKSMKLLEYEFVYLNHQRNFLEYQTKQVEPSLDELINRSKTNQTILSRLDQTKLLTTELQTKIDKEQMVLNRLKEIEDKVKQLGDSLDLKLLKDDIKGNNKKDDRLNKNKLILKQLNKLNQTTQNELFKFVDITYPNRSIQLKLSTVDNDTLDSPTSLKSLLQSLSNLPSDEYLTLPITEYVTLLYSANLIQPHPNYPNKFRLVQTKLF